MKFVELMNKIRNVTFAVLGILFRSLPAIQAIQSRSNRAPRLPKQAFYSIDDGQTYFADDLNRITPFDRDGKQAVRAVVIRSRNGIKSVGHLQRYSPSGRKRLEELRLKSPPSADLADQIADINEHELQVKRPGDSAWQSASSPKGMLIMNVQDSDGYVPEIVFP